MIARQPSRKFSLATAGAALSLALAAAVLTAPTPARAQQADDRPLDSRILGGILEGLGLRKDGEAIVYQERAPLVIPPTAATLPPPVNSDAVIANNPAWPKDPDVQRRKDEARHARANAYKSADEKFREESRVLSPSELTPGATSRGVSGPAIGRDRTATTFIESGDKLKPSELGYRGGLFSNLFGGKDEELARFTGEPPRTALTEPPPGYQTPSPDQPYGLSARTTAPKATNYMLERGTTTDK